MRITSVIALMAMTYFCTGGLAKGDDKVDVEMAKISLSSVDITLSATGDHHFVVADKLLDAGQLEAYFAKQSKSHPLNYVLVSGEKTTIGDLVAVAHVGEALHFTVLFESKGKLKSLKLVK
jgi:3-keto-L-gulonate-6-phosphate decarboxylase